MKGPPPPFWSPLSIDIIRNKYRQFPKRTFVMGVTSEKVMKDGPSRYLSLIFLSLLFLEVESNSKYRKYKESAHMACSTNPISQPSLDISPIWIPLFNEEVNKSNW
jgi:hypothetical protein